MLETIYINYTLLFGTCLVFFVFMFALIVWTFNFLFDFIQAVWSDIKYFFKMVIFIIRGVVLPLLRVWWIITRAPILLMLIILSTLRYLLSATLRIFVKYWRTYIYIYPDSFYWEGEQLAKKYDLSRFKQFRFRDMYSRYLIRLYPHKYKRDRYGYTLTFLWGYLIRWCTLLCYLTFYYFIFLLRKILYYIWLKPYMIDTIFFFFYYIYRTMGWWIHQGVYTLSWNFYVFVRRQLYYFIPNWLIADLLIDYNLDWFDWYFQGNLDEDDEETPDDLHMQRPGPRIVNFFYSVLPVSSFKQIFEINHPYIFARHSLFLVLRYIIVFPLCLLGILLINLWLVLINIFCISLFSTHKIWWKIYTYILRQQYFLYIFMFNIKDWKWYQILLLPLTKSLLLCLRLAWWIVKDWAPSLVGGFLGQILSVLFYLVYGFVWLIYFLPTLLITFVIYIGRLIFKFRVILLVLFLSYYWAYEQLSEVGALGIGIVQSSVEVFLRTVWFYIPISDIGTHFSGSNKYEYMRYWGGMHNLNTYTLIHYYGNIFKLDLAYMGYYRLDLASPQSYIQPENWPMYYNRQRGLRFYHRSFLDTRQHWWNRRFLKFVEGTLVWDPAPPIMEYWNHGQNFIHDDFSCFHGFRQIRLKTGKAVQDLNWVFQEEEEEKWYNLMRRVPYSFLFEPNVLQEEPEILPSGWFNWQSWENWFYYDLLNTAYLVPFDLPLEGNKQGVTGVTAPHLFSMINSVDPVEYSRGSGRQRQGLPILNSMYYSQILRQMKHDLLNRKRELVDITIELTKDRVMWDEIFSDNTEWQMRLYTVLAYPFKWFSVRWELIRIGLFKIFLYTRATFWLYYYFYEPQIRYFFHLSIAQNLIFIYPFKWLCFCWEVGNSVNPLPYRLVSLIYTSIWYTYECSVWYFLYMYYTLNDPYTIDYLLWLYQNIVLVLFHIKHKWSCLIYLFTNIKYLWLDYVYKSNLYDNIDVIVDGVDSLYNKTNIFEFSLLTWWYMVFYKIYIYLSLDQYYIYLSYKLDCYIWYWSHVIEGYLYLWEHSFYTNPVNPEKYSWFTFTECLSRECGLIDRRLIYEIMPSWWKVLNQGYIVEYGPLVTNKQIRYSWLSNVWSLINTKDWGIYVINYSFFYIWYLWDVFCQLLHNLLNNGQTYVVNEWHHVVKGWLPMLMVWMNKFQYWLDDIYIYWQFPRRLNKYGLTYTCRGYDYVDELNLMYLLRRANLGNTRTWKSLNMLTYLVLMVKYPNTWEHFTLSHNSQTYINGNGLRVVASKLYANVSAWSSGVYYFALLSLIFLSTNFRNLLFCDALRYNHQDNSREFKWQQARSQPGSKLRWQFIPESILPWVEPYLTVSNEFDLHVDYYTRLMVVNNQLPVGYKDIKPWMDQLKGGWDREKTLKGYGHRSWYLSPEAIAFSLNPHYYSFHRNFAYSSTSFLKFILFAQNRDMDMRLAGKNFELSRSYTEVDPAYLYNQTYVDLHMKQLDKWYYSNFYLDKYLFDFNLPAWAWHKDGFNMRIYSSKNPVDLTQQLTYVYEDERMSYIPWAIFGWFLAVPLCLVIKPLATLGEWTQHGNKEEPGWGWQLSFYLNNFWHHIPLMKHFYYMTGPWLPEQKLLTSLETDESEDYWHYHEQNAFVREFLYSYEEEDPMNAWDLVYARLDPVWESSLESMRLFTLLSLTLFLIIIIFAPIKKIPQSKINLSQIYLNKYIPHWDSIKYSLSSMHHFQKIFKWFWR